MRRAIDRAAIDRELDDERLSSCDVVIIALYPEQTIAWLRSHAPSIRSGALVFDCGGVKVPVCAPCEEIAREHGFSFIGAHPMAGVEHSGFDHSRGDMFHGASIVLTPPRDVKRSAVELLRRLADEIGFGRVVETTPEEHDRMIAYTSQLAHVVASAYIMSDTSKQHHGFSAGSYRDMTRVACLNEDMWTELFMENCEPLVDEISGLIGRLSDLRDAIAARDADRIRDLLRSGRERKMSVDGAVL